MADHFEVTAAWGKTSYTAGETITGTIAGDYVRTTVAETKEMLGPVTIPVVSSSGAASTISISQVEVTRTAETTVREPVLIDTTRPIVDNGPNPRNWVVSADRKSIRATA